MVCKLCGGIGHHKGWCWERGAVKEEPAPKPKEYRIELTGGLKVYHPVKP